MLYTDAEKDPTEALYAYRQRNDIELLFDDMKNIIDCNRLRLHIEQVIKGRIFINFITLIVLTALKEHIKLIPAREETLEPPGDPGRGEHLLEGSLPGQVQGCVHRPH